MIFSYFCFIILLNKHQLSEKGFYNLSLKISRTIEHRKITEEEFKKQKTCSGYAEYRNIAKHLNFLMLFGGGARMFAEHALETSWTPEQVNEYVSHMDPEILKKVCETYKNDSEIKQKYIAVAQVMKNNFFKAYPRLQERIDREDSFARQFGFCTSRFGSTRNFIELALAGKYDIKNNGRMLDNLSKISSNYRAQNYEASITKKAMYEMQCWLENNGYKSRLFNEIHDSMDVYIYKKELRPVLAHLQHLTERKIPELKETWVPLTVDCEIADLSDNQHNDTYKHGRSPIEFGIDDWDNLKYEDVDPFNVELYEEAEKEYFDKRAEYFKSRRKRDLLAPKIKEYLHNKYPQVS